MADYGVNINLRVKGQSGLDRLQAKVKQLSASIDKMRGIDIMNPRNTGGRAGKSARNEIKKYRQDMEALVKSVNNSKSVFGKTANQQIAAADALQEYSNQLIIGTKAHKAATSATEKQIRAIDAESTAIAKNNEMRRKNKDLASRMGGGNQFRGGMNPRGNRAAFTSGAISGAFPLLFGQGLLGGAAGFAGGFLGTKAGGQMGGFAGGLVATAVLQQLTTAKEKLEELGKAVTFFSFDVGVATKALGLAGTPQAEYIKLIEKSQGKQAAFNLVMQDMEQLVGEDGVKALQDFAEGTRELQNEITRFLTEVAANVAKLFSNEGGRVVGLSRRGLLRDALTSDNPEIQALIEKRDKTKNRRRIDDINDEILVLMQTEKSNKKNLDLEKLRTEQYNEITKSVENKNLFLNESLSLGTREAEIQEKLREFDRKALEFDKKINKQERLQYENALRLQPQLEKLNNLYQGIGSTIESGLVDAIQGAIDGTKTLGDVARSVFGEISRQLISFGVNAFLGGLFPNSSFFRANGGPVSTGKSYMVGERGPEMFVPNTGGRIVPNSDMGGLTNIVVNVDASGSAVEGDEAQGRELGRLISVAVQSEIIQQQRPGGLLT